MIKFEDHTTYRRGQIDWALWRLFRRTNVDEIPGILLSRIVRLLEVDRKLKDDFGSPQHAFFDGKPTSTGTETQYTYENAFCFAFAMMVMDLGYNQSDIVWLIQNSRKALGREVAALLFTAPTLADHEYSLKQFEAGTETTVDPRCFVRLKGVEMSEIYSAKPKKKEPRVLSGPDFLGSFDQMTATLNNMGKRSPDKCIILEVGYTARRLSDLLKVAPVRRRGRNSQ